LSRFFGRYEHTIDSKGRVILPARFRAAFEHGGFLNEHHDGCLALWTQEGFDAQMQQMQERARASRERRNLARFWASATYDMDVDRQGRMVIPAPLRTYAGLEQAVLVVGAIDRVELWSLERWQDKVGPEEMRLTQGLDD
jgi:MraZ protein